MINKQSSSEITLGQPLVSIALPVYNGAKTLAVAIKSILEQEYRNWELILLDDASSDHSLAIMESFDDSRIRVVAGEKNMGLSARLNMAADMALGDYFARMDQDDISFRDRLSKQVAYLEEHQSVDLLGSSVLVFSGEGEVQGVLPIKTEHTEICTHPWNGFHFPHPTWMGKTNWFSEHRYDSSADGVEDQQLLFRTYSKSHFACLEEPLLAYREVRSLKKMFRARVIFLRTFFKIAFKK